VQFDRRVVVGEVPALLGDFAQMEVDRLDLVGCVDHPADLDRER
jgi:hypothetical protein